MKLLWADIQLDWKVNMTFPIHIPFYYCILEKFNQQLKLLNYSLEMQYYTQ